MKPFTPPSVTCSANPTTVKSGETFHDHGQCDQPGWRNQITSYAYTASAGKITRQRNLGDS